MIIVEEKLLKNKINKNQKVNDKKHSFSFRKKAIYVGLLFLCSYMFSAVKMHEIKWMPSVNTISEYYQKNSNLINLENIEYLKDTKEMNNFLKEIDFEKQINSTRIKSNQEISNKKVAANPNVLTYEIISKIYSQDFYIYKKNTQFSGVSSNYFPDNDYVKYKLIQSINKTIKFSDLKDFNNNIDEKIKSYEKNMNPEQIGYIDNYIKIKNDTIKNLADNNKFLKQSSYTFSSFIYNIFNSDLDKNYNNVVGDFGLINGRILSDELIPKVISLIPTNEQKNINFNENYHQLTKEELKVIDQGIRK